MSAPSEQLHSLAEVDHCLREGACLLAEAAERVQAINRAGAPVGYQLIAARSLRAMQRTFELMHEHRFNLAKQAAAPLVASPSAQAARWWSFLPRRWAYQPKVL